MAIDIHFVDFPKSPKSKEIQELVQKRFEKCLEHLQLANEIHLNLIFKHVHFTTIELNVMVSGDKIHENVHVSGRDVPHTIDLGEKKLQSILRKMSDKLKSKNHTGRERRGHKKNNEFE